MLQYQRDQENPGEKSSSNRGDKEKAPRSRNKKSTVSSSSTAGGAANEDHDHAADYWTIVPKVAVKVSDQPIRSLSQNDHDASLLFVTGASFGIFRPTSYDMDTPLCGLGMEYEDEQDV